MLGVRWSGIHSERRRAHIASFGKHGRVAVFCKLALFLQQESQGKRAKTSNGKRQGRRSVQVRSAFADEAGEP